MNSSLITEKSIKMKTKILEKLKEATSLMAISVDAWTSVKQHLGFLGITVHFYIKNELQSVSLCLLIKLYNKNKGYYLS